MAPPAWRDAMGEDLGGTRPYGILGILNVTPDSFYDGGLFASPGAAARQADKLLAAGADVLDIGAESTRPGAEPVQSWPEWQRLAPVLADIRKNHPLARVSIDTRHARTAKNALDMGAVIVNDISACSHDPELLDVLAEKKPAYILTHSQGSPKHMQDEPRYANVVDEIKNFFGQKLAMLTRAGLPEDRVALDPGIGFGKTLTHNLDILRRFQEFSIFGRPLVAAVSMKSFLGALLDLPVAKRGEATCVASALLFEKGATWHRVHDPEPVGRALKLACAFQNAQGLP